MAADWTESGRYAVREMQDYERISNSDGGKEKPQRKTHGLRLRMKRDVVPRTEWHSVFRRSSNDRNHKSPQAQKTPVLRPKRWNLAEKRPASWRSYESCSLARFRSENCSFIFKSDVAGRTHRSGIPLFSSRKGVKRCLRAGCVALGWTGAIVKKRWSTQQKIGAQHDNFPGGHPS